MAGGIRPEAARQRGLSWDSGHRDRPWSPPRAGLGHPGKQACGSETSLEVDPESLDRRPTKGSRGRI